MKFNELPIPEEVMAGVRDCGFTDCTPIQALTLIPTLEGRDVAGQAQTGTGKTAAFLIALFTRLLKSERKAVKQKERSAPRALVIAPTRELAVQVEADAHLLGTHTGLQIAAVYGGVDYDKQRSMLCDDSIDVLIGTPGRLIDYFKQKVYTVKAVEVLVIDEADRMFDMGFIADLRYLMRRLPPYEERLSMLFSATLSYRAQELSYEYMNMPEVLAVKSEFKTAAEVRQQLFHVEAQSKISLLVGILRQELAKICPADGGPESGGPEAGAGRVMIFVNTKRMGERLQDWLHFNDIASGYLSGDVPQIKRLKVLRRFQQGEMPVLIATDVAGRGLHIDGVTHVVNYDMPENAEDYVHRIGRTARAGAQGDAISLVDEEGAYHLEAIEAFAGLKIPVAWADDSLYAKLERPPRRPRKEGEGDRKGGRGKGKGGGRPERKPRGGSSRSSGEASRADNDGTATGTPEEAGKAPAAPGGEGDDAQKKKKRRRRRRKSGGEGGAPQAETGTGSPDSGGSD